MKLKTLKKVIEEHKEYKRLINAVINRVGLDSVEDINKHGIQGGYSGFIYYSDTVAFASRHRKMICSLLDDDADSFGTEIVEMVSNFGKYRYNRMDEDDKIDLYRYLGGSRCLYDQIPNLMAWYAAETVCRWFEGD